MRRNSAENFWSKVDIRGPNECWPWKAQQTKGGYGRVAWHGRKLLAHRLAYELGIGPIPPELDVDHVKSRGCTMRLCCNPAHLEPVTKLENFLRGESPPAQNARKKLCMRGHRFIFRWGQRICMECQAVYNARKTIIRRERRVKGVA